MLRERSTAVSTSRMSNLHHYGGGSIEDGGGLHHRRTGSKSTPSKLPRPQLTQHQVSYSKNKDHHDGSNSLLSPWQSRSKNKLFYTMKRVKKTRGKYLFFIVMAALMIIITFRIAMGNGSKNISTSMRCSSFFRPFQKQNQQSESNIILMASHLRQGSDGEMRLRIIEHNLQLLAEQEHEEERLLEVAMKQSTNDNGSAQISKAKAFKVVLLFSIDTKSSQSDVNAMMKEWRQQIPNKHLAYDIISDIIFVPNDPTMVDAAKWIVAIEQLLPEIQYTNARVMLINDSFVLTRNVPELWSDDCGDVCGLVWTAPEDDESKHIQSYIRTLSSCAVERYRNFYYQKKNDIRNVHELIVEFELNLSWVGGAVSAIYDYAGGHPDDEEAQMVSVSKERICQQEREMIVQ